MMNQNQTGNISWAQKLLEKTTQQLDEYEEKLNIPAQINVDHDEIQEYMSMDINHLEKLSHIQCANISYRLAQFSLYVQKCINREKSKNKMLSNRINMMIAPRINQYRGSWDMMRQQAISENDVTKELFKYLDDSEQKIERLEFLSGNIKTLAEHMKNIQFAKSREEKAQF